MKYDHFPMFILCCAVFLFACGDSSSDLSGEAEMTPTQVAQEPTPTEEEPLASAELEEEEIVSGVDTVNLAQLQEIITNRVSKPLFVNFWATWCTPCLEEMPHINELFDQYRSKRIDFLAVSADYWTETVDNVPEMVEKLDMNLPVKVLEDSDADTVIRSIDPEWQGDLPATFVYSATGERVHKFFGAQDKETFEQAILSVLDSE